MIAITVVLGFMASSWLGIMEAMIYGGKMYDSFKFDHHKGIYVPMRLTIFLFAASFCFIDLNEVPFVLSCVCLSFPFFHDGFYYLGRKWIDEAYYGFFDMTTTSTAKTSFDPPQRVILFICSMLLLMLACLR